VSRPGPATRGGRRRAPVSARRWLAMALAGLMLTGCEAHDFENENDRLREQVMKLERQLGEAQKKLQRRQGQVQALEKKLTQAAGAPDVTEPMLSQLRLGRYSGPIDTDGDDRPDTLRLYLRTLDQDGRMLPVTAEARLQVVHIPDEGEPNRLIDQRFDREQLNDAYRASFMGEHYSLELDLPDSPQPEEITVRVTVHQLSTDAEFSVQETYTLPR